MLSTIVFCFNPLYIFITNIFLLNSSFVLKFIIIMKDLLHKIFAIFYKLYFQTILNASWFINPTIYLPLLGSSTFDFPLVLSGARLQSLKRF